jgi:PAS domain-containing protein
MQKIASLKLRLFYLLFFSSENVFTLSCGSQPVADHACYIYILLIINGSLRELRNAALKIADGETNIRLAPVLNDAVGSLPSSIIRIDEKNKELAEAPKKIGEGNFNVPIQPRSGNDLLGDAIVLMKNNLKSLTEDLEKSKEEFRTLADFLPQIIWTVRPDGYLDYYNKQWYKITGARRIWGSKLDHILHPEDVGNCLLHGTAR